MEVYCTLQWSTTVTSTTLRLYVTYMLKNMVRGIKGALHELNQMVNLRVNHLVKCRRVARDPNPRLKLT